MLLVKFDFDKCIRDREADGRKHAFYNDKYLNDVYKCWKKNANFCMKKMNTVKTNEKKKYYSDLWFIAMHEMDKIQDILNYEL